MEELTEVVHNGDLIPTHPANTTSRKVQHILEARDALDGTKCRASMPRSELMVLMRGEPILDHLYLYVALSGKVYTTRRNGIVLVVKCEDNDDAQPAEADPASTPAS